MSRYRYQPMPSFAAAPKRSIHQSAPLAYSQTPAAGVFRPDAILRRIALWLHRKQESGLRRVDTSMPYGSWASGWHDAAYPKGWDGPEHW